MDIPSLRRETRYGMPAADKIMFNRHYVLGYSYYFRQAKWALEIVDPDNPGLERLDNFRTDYRIPDMFRADRVDYTGSGYDRGHLVASANQRETELQNSETFLLSNMSPQEPQFNRGVWKELEGEVRRLDAKPKVYETYVICGPIFYFDQAVESIGDDDSNKVSIPVPHAYFKSVLAETNTGALKMWSFVLPNEESDKALETFRVPTVLVEQLAGIKLWERLVSKKIDKEKSKKRKMW
jgi:endonuclease G